MKQSTIAFAALCTAFILTGAGCSSAKTPPPATDTPAAATQNTEAEDKKFGAIPFDFPLQAATAAKPGEYVLAVPRDWIDQAFEDSDNATFIYYAAKMVVPGKHESQIEVASGEKMSVPNSLIIALGRNARAKKGDILLTWWQGGSGMQRAIVVGGSAAEPHVLYLDQEYNPNDPPETLLPNSFIVLSSPTQLGATIACKAAGEQDFTRYQLVNVQGDTYLTLGWAGKMSVQKKADCATLPITPTVGAGDMVYFPSFGTFDTGTVTEVNPAIGRVTIAYKFANQDMEAQVPFGDVAASFLR